MSENVAQIEAIMYNYPQSNTSQMQTPTGHGRFAGQLPVILEAW